MAILVKDDWPGNVRELENVLESASILSNSEIIQPQDIMLLQSLQNRGQSVSNTYEFIDAEMSLKETERLHIFEIMKKVKGDKKVAAKILGISLKTLYTKIAQYNPNS